MRFISDNALERIGEALQDCVDRMGDYLAGAESALALVDGAVSERPMRIRDLDGTEDAASWIRSGHVLDDYEVEFLRGLVIPNQSTDDNEGDETDE